MAVVTGKRASAAVGIAMISAAIGTLSPLTAAGQPGDPDTNSGSHGVVANMYADRISAIGPYLRGFVTGRCVRFDGRLVNCDTPGVKFKAEGVRPGVYRFVAQVSANDRRCLSGTGNLIQTCDSRRQDQKWIATKPKGQNPGQPPWGLVTAASPQPKDQCLDVTRTEAAVARAVPVGGVCRALWK